MLMLIALNARAQHVTNEFLKLQASDGLPNNSVSSIARDSLGCMWFGTYEGLSRFDSRVIRNYVNNPNDPGSISSSAITALLYDKSGRLWIGTNHGLNLYQPQLDKFQKFFPLANRQPGPQQKIKSIYEDSRGVLWVGTVDRLYSLDPRQSPKLKPVLPASDFGIDQYKFAFTGACQGADNVIWAVRGQALLQMGAHSAEPGAAAVKVKWQGLDEDDFITAMAVDQNQTVWLGSRAGRIGCFDSRKKVFVEVPFGIIPTSPLSLSQILSIHIAQNGVVRFGTGNGLIVWEPRIKRLSRIANDPSDESSISDNFVYAIFQGADGILWLGTYTSGINYQLPDRQHFNMLGGSGSLSNLTNNTVSCVGTDKANNLYVGTLGGGLNIVGHLSKKVIASKGLFAPNIMSMIVKENGDIWLAEDFGLRFYSQASHSWQFFKFGSADGTIGKRYSVSKIIEDDKGKILLGTVEGLIQFDPSTFTFSSKFVGRKPLAIATLFKDSHGDIWIGESRSVYLITRQGTQIREVPVRWRSNDRARKGGTYTIAEDLRGTIWTGGINLGLLKYNRTKGYLEEYECDGLFQATRGVSNIEVDGLNRLWLGMVYNLSVLDPGKKKVIHFGKADGISATEFMLNGSYKSGDGKLYFGTNKGLLYFNPLQTSFDTAAPKLFLTSLDVAGKTVRAGDATGILSRSITYTDEIALCYNQNFFTLNFSLINFTNPEKNMFAYKLEGLNQDWNFLREPYVSFNNLAPGEYTLLLKGASNDHTWVERPLRFRITIKPPFWRTWWAFLLYVLLTGAVVFLIVRLLWFRASLRRNMVTNQLKIDFFTNISHEIRTSLTLILAPLNKSLSLPDGHWQIRQNLEYTQKGTNRLLTLVTELLDFGRLENGELKLNIQKTDLVNLIQDVVSTYKPVLEEKKLSVRTRNDHDQVFAHLDAHQIQKVLSNLIANACKFTDPGGWIEIELTADNSDVNINVSDNGRGILPENLDNIFANYFQEYEYHDRNTGYGIGLAMSKRIVDLHFGTLRAMNWENRITGETGARFTVSLPKNNRALPESSAPPAASRLPAKLTGPSDMNMESLEQEPLRRSTVLLAEDHGDLRRFLADSLAEEFHVIECWNGEQALTEIFTRLPDIVVTDIMMPVIDGLDLCSRIKQDERTNHIPVIILTAKATDADIEAGLKSRADHYIIKPFNFIELSLRIRNLLSYQNALRSKFSSSLYNAEFKLATAVNHDEIFIKKLIAIVEANMHVEDFGVEFLAKEIGMSRTILYKKIKAVTDMSVNDFVKNIKISRAAELLKSDTCSIYEVADRVGFNDSRYFSKEFKRVYGLVPSQYVRQHRLQGRDTNQDTGL